MPSAADERGLPRVISRRSVPPDAAAPDLVGDRGTVGYRDAQQSAHGVLLP